MRKRSNSSFILPSTLHKTDFASLAKSEGENCENYSKLREKIAQLACGNPDFILFFRGQKSDYSDQIYKNVGSSFFPSIYRGSCTPFELSRRWAKLNYACQLLKERLKIEINNPIYRIDQKRELQQVINRRILQWAIIQHYEVADTPLLDVSQSLRVACSFATMSNDTQDAYIYAFAIPYFTGRISVNSEHMLTNIRLLSIAPSMSLRPHFQEGFLLGEEDLEEKDHKSQYFDFRRRLVGKFKIPNNAQFWENGDLGKTHERALTKEELYPEEDNFTLICQEIKDNLNLISLEKDSKKSDSTGYFLMLWGELESLLRRLAKVEVDESRFAVAKAISLVNDKNLRDKLQNLRKHRNELAHSGVTSIPINKLTYDIESAIQRLNEVLRN